MTKKFEGKTCLSFEILSKIFISNPELLTLLKTVKKRHDLKNGAEKGIPKEKS